MVTSQITSSVRHRISVISIVPYLIMTFSIAWAILALYIFLPVQMTGIFGQLSGTHPLFYLAVWAPAISAFTIIVIKEGINGLMGFLARIKLWRTSMMWYFFLIVGVPVIFYAGAALKGNLLTLPFCHITVLTGRSSSECDKRTG